MIYPGRYIISALFFVAAGISLFTIDKEDRGHHFVQAAAAKTDRSGTYDLAKARILTKVIGHVRSHYVDPTRLDPKEMAVAALQAAQSQVPEIMVRVIRNRKEQPTAIDVMVATESKQFELTRVSDLYELNWKIMDIPNNVDTWILNII